MKQIIKKWISVFGVFALIVGAFSSSVITQAEAATVWNVGDVFVGVSNGQYKAYDNNGVFKETLSDGLGGGANDFTTGCSFNNALDKLYTTYFGQTKVKVFDDPTPHTLSQVIDTALINPGGQSESIIFAANGDFFVGHPDGNDDIQRYNAAGVYQQSYDVAIEARGSDWMDLAADQKTLFYTSEGRQIKRYDVSTDTQLADFATLPGPRIPSIAFALRLLPPGDGNGGLLVADNDNIKRLDGTGAVIETYDAVGEDDWFALNLDPNGTSFWSGNIATGNFYRFNIASGAIEVGPINIGNGTLAGVCLKGELTAALPETTLDPLTADNEVGTNHAVTATIKAGGNPVPNKLVKFSVVAGPNTGEISDPGECAINLNCNTDANGQTTWTYTSNGTAGTDTIVACFTDDNGKEQCAKAQKRWTEKIVGKGRFTGGGTITKGNPSLEGKHGFELHCDATVQPNRLEVNWGKGNKFHLENLDSAVCVDTVLDEQQPIAGFDTYRGEGTGRYNGVSGYTAKWNFTDAGEPGVNDHAKIEIFDPANVLVATFDGNLTNGNQQAHPEQ